MAPIRTLFSPGHIDRPIESVITYGRDDEAALRSEVSEYYVTEHINQGMKKLLEEMRLAQQGQVLLQLGFEGVVEHGFLQFQGANVQGPACGEASKKRFWGNR